MDIQRQLNSQKKFQSHKERRKIEKIAEERGKLDFMDDLRNPFLREKRMALKKDEVKSGKGGLEKENPNKNPLNQSSFKTPDKGKKSESKAKPKEDDTKKDANILEEVSEKNLNKNNLKNKVLKDASRNVDLMEIIPTLDEKERTKTNTPVTVDYLVRDTQLQELMRH